MNMLSVIEQPSVIDNYLQTEIAHGRIAGPFPKCPFPYLYNYKLIWSNTQEQSNKF